MKSGEGAALLIACIADEAVGAGKPPSARITNVEKAKNTPPTTPAPMAATTVNVPATPASSDDLSAGTSHTPGAAAARA